MAEAATYPVSIRGDLSEPINRWLFLIKWLLAIPHLIVLFFLSIPLIFSWLISLFAILFTGRYPRSLFDFNVGVLRWSWRLGFYSYHALGTDKYPPFSLKSNDDYPADLNVDYPENLHRGLALIKWWLLAIPHYLALGFLQGGQGYKFGGLQFLLVIICAVYNLFTGKYHRDIFSIVMGINHWAYRVGAYTLLVTDRYPPFRLGK